MVDIAGVVFLWLADQEQKILDALKPSTSVLSASI